MYLIIGFYVLLILAIDNLIATSNHGIQLVGFFLLDYPSSLVTHSTQRNRYEEHDKCITELFTHGAIEYKINASVNQC